MHAWEAEGVQPDIQCVAKTLGSGYAAISAVLINKRVIDAMMGGDRTFVNGELLSKSEAGPCHGRKLVFRACADLV